jgi:hypothetical protein
MTFCVYGLVDPDTMKVRYIGGHDLTNDPRQIGLHAERITP